MVVLFSLNMGGAWSYTAVVVLFVLIPAIELFTKASSENMTDAEAAAARNDFMYDLLLYSLVPIQYITLGLFLFRVSDAGVDWVEKLGMTISFGLSCGILGINVAHELGHRSTRFERTLSKMLLLSTLYMHFFIEHNRGHHKNVSTEEDPASSRMGENLYAFFIRSITGGWFSAWNLERLRLQKKGQSVVSLRNEMVQFQLWQLALVAIIYVAFGPIVLAWYVAAAVTGWLLLETVNYIEHYGLRRVRVGEHYERTRPVHSWNSSHPLGRLILFELTRHSDHHYLASRKYQMLRHFDESPQMPTGYPGMMLLALIPSLWYRVMHKQIASFRQTEGGKHLG